MSNKNYASARSVDANPQSSVSQPMATSSITTKADLTESASLDKLGNSLNNISTKIDKINDYNTETKMMTDVYSFNQQAKLNKWTPEEYQKQWNNFYGKLSANISKPSLKAQVDRFADLHYASTFADLQVEQHKKVVAEALVGTFTTMDNIASGVTDANSFSNAYSTMQGMVKRSVDNGILNPGAAVNILEKYKNSMLSNVVNNSIMNNPSKFMQELKSGTYDNVMSATEKAKSLNMAKNQIVSDERKDLFQRNYDYAQNMNDILSQPLGDITDASIEKSVMEGKISSSMAMSIKNYKNGMNTSNNVVEYGNILNDIENDKYKGNDGFNVLQSVIAGAVDKGSISIADAKRFFTLAEQRDKAVEKGNSPINKTYTKQKLTDLSSSLKTNLESSYTNIDSLFGSNVANGSTQSKTLHKAMISRMLADAHTMYYKEVNEGKTPDEAYTDTYNYMYKQAILPYMKESPKTQGVLSTIENGVKSAVEPYNFDLPSAVNNKIKDIILYNMQKYKTANINKLPVSLQFSLTDTDEKTGKKAYYKLYYNPTQTKWMLLKGKKLKHYTEEDLRKEADKMTAPMTTNSFMGYDPMMGIE